jgi:gluconolactonase
MTALLDGVRVLDFTQMMLGPFATQLLGEPSTARYVALYQPSAILRIEPFGSAGIVCEDPDAHLLCHPTNIAFRGDELLCANLGRWHVTAIDAGIGGVALPPGGPA